MTPDQKEEIERQGAAYVTKHKGRRVSNISLDEKGTVLKNGIIADGKVEFGETSAKLTLLIELENGEAEWLPASKCILLHERAA